MEREGFVSLSLLLKKGGTQSLGSREGRTLGFLPRAAHQEWEAELLQVRGMQQLGRLLILVINGGFL